MIRKVFAILVFWLVLLAIALGGFSLWAVGMMKCIHFSRELNWFVKALIGFGYIIFTMLISAPLAFFIKWFEAKCDEFGKIGRQV
jgi:hypothetical protein